MKIKIKDERNENRKKEKNEAKKYFEKLERIVGKKQKIGENDHCIVLYDQYKCRYYIKSKDFGIKYYKLPTNSVGEVLKPIQVLPNFILFEDKNSGRKESYNVGQLEKVKNTLNIINDLTRKEINDLKSTYFW